MWFWRDCDACQKYLLDSNNRIMRNRSGRALPNPSPPRCRTSPCSLAAPETGARTLRPRFTPEDMECYRRWRMCRAFKTLPRSGGLADQNPWDMARFEILERAEQADEARRDTEERKAFAGLKPKRKRS